MAVPRLTSRRDFLRLRQSPYKWIAPSLIVQSASMPLEMRQSVEGNPFRVGFVVTKKVGKAVVRNRVKRRLRAVVNGVFPHAAQKGCDYVIIARPLTLQRPFIELKEDMETALHGLQRKMKRDIAHD